MVVVAAAVVGLPSQLRVLRTLATLGLLEDAAVREDVGLPSGLGAKGTMLMVERVGIALADLVDTCPGRRAGERGEGKGGGSRESRRLFLSDCCLDGLVATVGWPGGWMDEWIPDGWKGGWSFAGWLADGVAMAMAQGCGQTAHRSSRCSKNRQTDKPIREGWCLLCSLGVLCRGDLEVELVCNGVSSGQSATK